MTSSTTRNRDRQTKARPRVRPGNLAEAIQRRFRPLGGVELRLPEREPLKSRVFRDKRRGRSAPTG